MKDNDLSYVEENRQAFHEDAAKRGHDLGWTYPNKGEPDMAHFAEGTCKHCGFTVSVGPTWSSARTKGDARAGQCRGPGTAWQHEMEMELASQRFQRAASAFLQELLR